MQTLPADAGAAADASIAVLVKLAHKLGPLIGHASVQLLVSRSIHANRLKFPWLGDGDDTGFSQPPYGALLAVMRAAGGVEAAAATKCLLAAYVSLLTSLIGHQLTDQFVRAALAVGVPATNTRSKSE